MGQTAESLHVGKGGRPDGGRKPTAWLAAIGGLIAAAASVTAILAYVGIGPFENGSSGSGLATSGEVSAAPSFQVAARSIHTTRLEIGDVRSGIRVYAGPSSTTNDLPDIPFGRRVKVLCGAPNFTGMASVNALYLVATPPWRGLFASANEFANGATLGVSTNNDPIDLKVPACPSG
jgi:hypothetical protein